MADVNGTAGAQEAPAADVSGSALPEFKPGTYYSVELSRQVEFPPGSGSFMRPGETHQWDGAFCESMKDAISGAVAVGGTA